METNTQNTDVPPRWATREMLAKHYGVCLRTITHWMSRGLLVFFKIGRVVRFDVAACDLSLKDQGLI